MQNLGSRIAVFKPAFSLIYLSLMGSLCVVSVQKYLGQPFDPVHCFSFMGIIFGVYTLNRFTDTAEDFTNDISRLLFFQNKYFFFLLSNAILVFSFTLLFYYQKLNWMHFLLLGIGFAYSFKMVPWYKKGQGLFFYRIKEMTFVKNLAVSFLWGSAIFVLPILYVKETLYHPFTIWVLAIGLFLSTLNNTLFDDILDEAGDRVAGIKTLPTTWGSKKSQQFLIGLDLLWLAGILFFYFVGKLEGAPTLFLSAMALYPFLYFYLHSTKKVSTSLIDLISESDLLFFGIGMYVLCLV